MNKDKLVVSKYYLIAGAVVLAAIVGGITYAVASNKSSSETSQESKVESQDEPKSSKEEIAQADIYDIGEEVKFSTRSIIVKDADTVKSVSNYGESHAAEPGSKYLIVTFTEKNLTNQPFNSEAYSILNNEGKLIFASTDEEGFTEDSLTFKTLNPDVPVTGTNLFVIPEDLEETNFGYMNNETGRFAGVKISF